MCLHGPFQDRFKYKYKKKNQHVHFFLALVVLAEVWECVQRNKKFSEGTSAAGVSRKPLCCPRKLRQLSPAWPLNHSNEASSASMDGTDTSWPLAYLSKELTHANNKQKQLLAILLSAFCRWYIHILYKVVWKKKKRDVKWIMNSSNPNFHRFNLTLLLFY